MISWLHARLGEQMAACADPARRIEIDTQIRLLALHSQVKPVDEYEQMVWPFRAQCVSESWTCYSDGKELVQAPCLHVRLIARPLAWMAGFPSLLAVTDDELAPGSPSGVAQPRHTPLGTT